MEIYQFLKKKNNSKYNKKIYIYFFYKEIYLYYFSKKEKNSYPFQFFRKQFTIEFISSFLFFFRVLLKDQTILLYLSLQNAIRYLARIIESHFFIDSIDIRLIKKSIDKIAIFSFPRDRKTKKFFLNDRFGKFFGCYTYKAAEFQAAVNLSTGSGGVFPTPKERKPIKSDLQT